VKENLVSDTFKCKTDKNGEFEVKKDKHVPTNPFTGNLMADKVSLKGKLTKPPKLLVEGTLSFNGSKKTFKKKTGEEQNFGTFPLKADNTIVLDGKVTADGGDAPKEGTELIFEVDAET
jgi:hypothetical protein